MQRNTSKHAWILQAFGANTVCGPLYSCIGKTEFMRDKDRESKYAMMGLKEEGRYVEDRNVFLAVEPLNRYETRLVNLVSDCARMLRDADSPSVKLISTLIMAI